MFSHEQLEVYKKTIEFLGELFKIISVLPSERSDIVQQLRHAAIAMPINIALGAEAAARKDRRKFYDIVHSSALECAIIFDLMMRSKYIAPHELRRARSLLKQIIEFASALC